MRKKQLISKDHRSHRENQYDDMKNMLNISRSLNEQTQYDIDIDSNDGIDVQKKRKNKGLYYLIW